jgi:hypothetical protein
MKQAEGLISDADVVSMLSLTAYTTQRMTLTRILQ